MKLLFSFLVFMVIWVAGCAFVDFVVPDIANAWIMAIGFCVGLVGLLASDACFGDNNDY